MVSVEAMRKRVVANEGGRSVRMRCGYVLCLVAQSCLTVCDPQTVACQAPLSTEFPSMPTEVGCDFLLQGILPTQGSNHVS